MRIRDRHTLVNRRGRMAMLNVSLAPAANPFRLCGVLQSSAHALDITERSPLHRAIQRSGTLSPFRSWQGCIINTFGYNFRKGQVMVIKWIVYAWEAFGQIRCRIGLARKSTNSRNRRAALCDCDETTNSSPHCYRHCIEHTIDRDQR